MHREGSGDLMGIHVECANQTGGLKYSATTFFFVYQSHAQTQTDGGNSLVTKAKIFEVLKLRNCRYVVD